MSIRDKLNLINHKLPAGVQLVAVSKTMPAEAIMEAYEAGQRIFGENRVRELIMKQPKLPADIRWHFIGHLQTNKVKNIVPYVDLVQSIDSLKLLKEINKEAKQIDRVVRCLLQFHISLEETKFGLSMEEAVTLLTSPDYLSMRHILICGVMGMATNTKNPDQVRKEFRELKAIYETLKARYFVIDRHFCEISMGMTGDYAIAAEEGSTMVRLGTAVFGRR